MKAAAAGTTTVAAVGTLNSSTLTSFGFYYDGKPSASIYIYVNNIMVAKVTDMTNLPASTIQLVTGVGVKNGAAQAVVKTLTSDYIFAAANTDR